MKVILSIWEKGTYYEMIHFILYSKGESNVVMQIAPLLLGLSLPIWYMQT